jgi:hypothetical protein
LSAVAELTREVNRQRTRHAVEPFERRRRLTLMAPLRTGFQIANCCRSAYYHGVVDVARLREPGGRVHWDEVGREQLRLAEAAAEGSGIYEAPLVVRDWRRGQWLRGNLEANGGCAQQSFALLG